MKTIEELKALEGDKMAEALGLKPVGGYPTLRYQLGREHATQLEREHATKTALGVYETVLRLAEEAKREVDSIETATGSLSHE